MTPQEIQDLLTQPRNAIIAVNRPAGGPQVTPVWYFWDGEDFYFFTLKNRAKHINIERNPTISLIVDGGPRYVAAYGEARIVDPAAFDVATLAIQLTSKYLPPEAAEQRAKRMHDANIQAILFKLHPEKVVAIDVE
jgi:PPOX class probable F420-dependent enzyme